MKPRILFVDDEPNMIAGLRRSLRSLEARWEIEFSTSAPEALQRMARDPFDVVVSDMRMPGMDGARLLEQVERLYPSTVRIVLSGSAGMPDALASLRPTHQYLAKPCDAGTIAQTVQDALKLRNLLNAEKVRELVTQTASVPSLPALYVEIMQELNSPECSIQRVATIIGRDAGMTAKILQVANSAFFGLRGDVSTPSDAIFRLGLETVKALALSVKVFSTFETSQVKKLKLTRVWPHSISVASHARAMAAECGAGPSLLDTAFTAGLLHDVGKLVLATSIPERYAQVLDHATSQEMSEWQAEDAMLGATHAQVGAYLIGLWGLPDPLVEAIAHHHRPGLSGEKAFGPAAAVHLADILEHERGGAKAGVAAPLDAAHFETIGLTNLVEQTRAVHETAVAEE